MLLVERVERHHVSVISCVQPGGCAFWMSNRPGLVGLLLYVVLQGRLVRTAVALSEGVRCKRGWVRISLVARCALRVL